MGQDSNGRCDFHSLWRVKILEEAKYSQKCGACVQLVGNFTSKGRYRYFYQVRASCRLLTASAFAFLHRLGSVQGQ